MENIHNFVNEPNMKYIYSFFNEPIQNKFNQSFNYYIYENILKLDFGKLKQDILNLEKEIIEKYPPYSDGKTGLGNNSLTSRFKYYNLLQMDETKFLKDIIREKHDDFLNTLEYEVGDNYYVQCWANVMRGGEQIKTHNHACNNHMYLTGHICVFTENTNTHYIAPYHNSQFSSKNMLGKMTLFPSWLNHYTDEVNTDLRITIAFDIMEEESWNIDVIDDMKHHWEKI
tara:strand:- start:193 stop:876 length:684 start_codon:yes stop_codon:yes gene_type:complete